MVTSDGPKLHISIPPSDPPLSIPPNEVQSIPPSVTEVLEDVLQQMKKQNELQVDQLRTSAGIVQQLNSNTKRTTILIIAAFVLVVLGGFQQGRLEQVTKEQKNASDSAKSIEKSVNQKVSDSSANVVQKVEQLERTNPRVVTDSHGGISLSFPVTPPPANALPTIATRPKKKHPPSPPPTATVGTPPLPPAPAPADYVLVPLKGTE